MVLIPFTDAVIINPTIKLKKGDEYPFVDMASVSRDSRTVYALEKREYTGGGSKFQDGDTLMARITPCLENGKISRYKAKLNDCLVGFGSTEFLVIRGKPSVTDNDFAYYLTQWDEFQNFAISQMTGSSGRQRVPVSALSHFFVNLPPLPVQKKIAAILSSLDDKIEINTRMNKVLEETARALFHRWFVEFEFPNDEGKPYKSSGGRMIASEMGEIPEGWRVTSLEEHTEVMRGFSYKGSGLADSGIPLYNLNSVLEGGGYKYAGVKYYCEDFKDKFLINEGDIIVANTEQGHKYLLIGYPAIIPKRSQGIGIFSHHLYRIRLRSTSPCKKYYLYYLLMSPQVREQIIGCTNGTTVNMLKIDGLQRPVFVLPDSDIMGKFEKIISQYFQLMEGNHREIDVLGEVRDTLLPRLICGTININY